MGDLCKEDVTTRILEELSIRKKRAKEKLNQSIYELQLPHLFGFETSWAIVGGAVRDSVLFPDVAHKEPKSFPWPDIDIAVAGDGFSQALNSSSPIHSRARVHFNTFGGWRVLVDSTELDVWQLPQYRTAYLNISDWRAYLKTVDFSINAIAYVWPQRRIIIDRRWLTSLKHKRIRKMSDNSPRKELQPLRAIALAVKMESITGCKFQLEKLIWDDLKWLVTQTDEKTHARVIEYLRKKTRSGRWPGTVASAFLSEVILSRGFTQKSNHWSMFAAANCDEPNQGKRLFESSKGFAHDESYMSQHNSCHANSFMNGNQEPTNMKSLLHDLALELSSVRSTP